MEIFYLDIVIIINILLHSIALTECSIGNFEIIKGIPIENAKLYAHGKDFSCFDGTLIIPYSYINDDYCDCIDASDEPGTSACPNGTYYCLNKGHFPSVVPSSRVNDGICDCCDGSDEWASNFQKDACQNTCENLSHEARGEANRVHNLYALGFKIREQLIAKGKYLLLQKQNKILHLLTKTKEAQFNRSSMFNDKEIAKEKEKKAIEEEKSVKKEILNQDFNHNSDNETEKYNIEDIEAVRINKLLYTEKTKIIINESKKAHELFEEADRTVKDLQKQIYELKKSISKNFGPEDEFAALDGQCYELTNDEYIYKLCLFEKITQRPIKGGPEVHLGVWKDWANFMNDKPQYHTMIYDRGQQCLNHFQRFAYVHLSCGLKPKLISVSEVNRCEYLMEFELPSVCVIEDNKYLRELEREEL